LQNPLPRSLLLLWQDWQTEIGGRKPDKDFTPTERGAVKFSYSRRKSVWDTINRLIRSRPGYTAATAIQEILLCYGKNNMSVTMVIDAIVCDKKWEVIPIYGKWPKNGHFSNDASPEKTFFSW
jgi:hypothetical protein